MDFMIFMNICKMKFMCKANEMEFTLDEGNACN